MTILGATDTYHVEAFSTADGWWAVRVVGLKFGYTQAAHFDEVKDAARDLIACSLDIDETDVGTIVINEKVWS
jgi:hypothetical protein